MLLGLLLLIFTRYGWLRAAGAVILLLGVYALFFFRDPHRVIQAAENEIVSPADGTIVGIETLPESPFYDGPCKRISIFLSLFNVHVNRAPDNGTIVDITYKPGEFLNAADTASSTRNEANTVRLDTPHGPMTVRQIAGLIARRIVCPVKPGAKLSKGEKFGMIRFGSRTELYLPATAEPCVGMRQKVKAGETIVARMP